MGSRLSIFSRAPAKDDDTQASPEKTAQPTPVADTPQDQNKCGCGDCKCDPCNCSRAVDTLTEAVKTISLEDAVVSPPTVDIAQEAGQPEVKEVPVPQEAPQEVAQVKEEPEVPQEVSQQEVPQEPKQQELEPEQSSQEVQSDQSEMVSPSQEKTEESAAEATEVKCLCSPCLCDPCKCGCHEVKPEAIQSQEQSVEEPQSEEAAQGTESEQPSHSESQTPAEPPQEDPQPVLDETAREIAAQLGDEITTEMISPEEFHALDVPKTEG